MHTYRKYFSLPIIVVTVLVLIGWIFDIIILKSILPSFISMNPMTAICLMLHAAGVFLLGKYPLSNIILKLIAGFTQIGKLDNMLSEIFLFILIF